MLARKYVLVIATPDSALAAVAKDLSGFEFRVTLARTEQAGMDFIDNAPDISLVAVDGASVSDPSKFLYRLRDHHRDLPVMWLADPQNQATFRGEPPNVMLQTPLDSEAFRTQANALMFDDFYPKTIVHGLLSSGNAVLATGFEVPVECGDPWLKLTERLAGNVHAYIPFMADSALGHLMAGGDLAALAGLGEHLGFDLDEGARQVAIDVAGEIANQVLGRMKSDCPDALQNVRMGVPIVWVGEAIDAHFSSKKPNLVVEFETQFGAVYLDFGLHAFTAGEGAEEEEFMAPGDLELF